MNLHDNNHSNHDVVLSEVCICALCVGQGECLLPLLFGMFLNDIEEEFMQKGLQGIAVNMFKICFILYADNVMFTNCGSTEHRNCLDVL